MMPRQFGPIRRTPRRRAVSSTVCSSAAGEACPAYLGPVLRAHWGVEDPAHATGDDEAINAAFMTAYRILRTRIEAFLSLPLTELKSDPACLKAHLDRIGTPFLWHKFQPLMEIHNESHSNL